MMGAERDAGGPLSRVLLHLEFRKRRYVGLADKLISIVGDSTVKTFRIRSMFGGLHVCSGFKSEKRSDGKFVVFCEAPFSSQQKEFVRRLRTD